MKLCWHRRDLRVRDNTALTEAATDGPVVPVFVVDPELLEYAGPPRVRFMIDALQALRGAYRDRGGDLIVRRGDPAELLADLASDVGAEDVVWNADYSGLARERDEHVRTALDGGDASVETTTVHDALLHEPGSIRTNEGEVYSVYSYFGKKWRDRPKDDPCGLPSSEDLATVVDLAPVEEPGVIPTLEDLGFAQPEATVEPASPERARDRLTSFCDDAIYRYEESRDFPAESGTARLSSHLKWGTIGPRTVYAATERAYQRAPEWASEADADRDVEAARESVREFQSQLAWRDFYGHVLWNRPDTVRSNFKSYEQPIEWRDDPAALQRWKDGETGYPIVDAGMRQLRTEAWMHNRVRMIVAAFLTKDLLIDWREGYAWFREKLADHDTANDVGGWQWAASTGTDAQPYFRIFNPTTQGERYDPDAEYIQTYVEELADVPADAIHDWPNLDPGQRRALAPEYPAPIVDHAERREAAIATFEQARGDD